MLMALPLPETSYSTVSVAPGVVDPVGGAVVGSVGSGRTGTVGVRDVVVGGAVVLGVVKLGSVGVGRGATTVCCLELLTITSAMTNPMTASTATAARIHSQRGDFGSSGGGGSWGPPPGGYWPPYWPVP